MGQHLAPIGDLLSFCLLLRTFWKSGKDDFRRYIWLSLSLASLSWLRADIAWVTDIMLFNRNPDNSQLILLLYLGTNVFYVIAFFIFAKKSIKKWNVLQLFVDTLAISLSCLFLIFIIFLNKDLKQYSCIC